MVKKPAEIQREIAEQRALIEGKLSNLNERVRTDLHDANSALNDDIMRRTHLDEHVERRPLTVLAAAFGGGVLLGLAGDSAMGTGSRSHSDERPSSGGHGDGSDGFMNQITGALSGVLGSTLQDEVRQVLRQMLRTDEEPAHWRTSSNGVPVATRRNGDSADQRALPL
jgi:hypothetical protein